MPHQGRRRNYRGDGINRYNGNQDANINSGGSWILGSNNSNGNDRQWNGNRNHRCENEYENDLGDHKHRGNGNRYNNFGNRLPRADYILALLREGTFNPETLRDLVSATTCMLELAWVKRQKSGMTEQAIIREFQIPFRDCMRLQELSRRIIDISLMPDVDGDILMSDVDDYPIFGGQKALGTISLGHEAVGRIIGLGL